MLVRTAHASEFDLVCDTLACGFFDDPLFRFMFPDPARRAKALPFFFAAYAGLAREYGKLLLSEDSMGALVLYLPGHAPGGPHLSPQRLAELMAAVREASGPDAPTVAVAMDALCANRPPGTPHFCGMFAAVRPEHRGQGHRTALFTHWAQMMDRTGWPGYALTTNHRSRSLLQRLGWQDAGPPCGPVATPAVFCLWRDARCREMPG
jgi:GNAT superfamily N-acetyltransferase